MRGLLIPGEAASCFEPSAPTVRRLVQANLRYSCCACEIRLSRMRFRPETRFRDGVLETNWAFASIWPERVWRHISSATDTPPDRKGGGTCIPRLLQSQRLKSYAVYLVRLDGVCVSERQRLLLRTLADL